MVFDARFYPWALLAVTFMLCLQTVLAGAVPQVAAAHDCAIFYDAGWRAYCGSRPHLDFYSGLGPATYLFVAAGYCLFGLTVHSLAYMNAMLLGLVVGVTWFSLRGRVTDFWLFWASLLVGLCSMAPHCLRSPVWDFSYAMLYNRQGNALMMLLVMLLYCPRGAMNDLQARMCSFLVGVIISFLFFLKVNFFVAACVGTSAYFIIERDRWIHLKYMAGGLILCSLIFLIYLKFDVVSMYNDLSIAGRAKSTYLHRYPYAHLATLIFSVPWLFIYLFLLWCGLRYSKDVMLAEGAKLRNWREIALGVLVCGLAMFIIMSNAIWGESDHPVLVAFGIVLCARFIGTRDLDLTAAFWKRQGGGPLAGACLLLMTGFMTIPYLLRDALSVMLPRHLTHDLQRMQDPAIADLEVFPDPIGEAFLRKTNDGVRLLKQEDLKGKSVQVMHFSSIIAFAARCPSEGGSVFWDYNNSFAMNAHPSPERTIGKASYVMISREPGHLFEPSQLGDCYFPYIKAHYTLKRSSDEWELWERNPAPSGSR